MARKYLVSLDLSKNELQNAVVQVLATAPSSPVEGQLYYNSVDHKAYIYNGSSWKALDENVALDFGESADIAASAPGDTAAAGSTGEVADAGHRHARESFATTASTQAIGDAASAGSGSDVSRGDHKHAMPSFGSSTAETSFGGAQANGTASTVARSDHQHGNPAHDASAHGSISLSSLSVPTSALSIGSQRLTNVADPVSDSDAATKGYADSLVQGLSWKDSVRAATTTSGTLSTAFENGDTIDGVTLATGDRILVKDQSTGSQNGIYVVNATGAPTRAIDANTAAELRGAAVFVEEGTVNAGKQYVLTTDNITLDSTALDFVQFGGGTTYAAGDGLTLSSSTFNVGAGTGISVAADTVSIDTSVVARKYATTLSTSATSYTVTHNLGTKDVTVQVFATDATGAQVECDVEHDNVNSVTLRFASAPSANAYRVIVVG